MFMIGFGIFAVLFCLLAIVYYMYHLCKTDNLCDLLMLTWMCVLVAFNSTVLLTNLNKLYGFGG